MDHKLIGKERRSRAGQRIVGVNRESRGQDYSPTLQLLDDQAKLLELSPAELAAVTRSVREDMRGPRIYDQLLAQRWLDWREECESRRKSNIFPAARVREQILSTEAADSPTRNLSAVVVSIDPHPEHNSALTEKQQQQHADFNSAFDQSRAETDANGSPIDNARASPSRGGTRGASSALAAASILHTDGGASASTFSSHIRHESNDFSDATL